MKTEFQAKIEIKFYYGTMKCNDTNTIEREIKERKKMEVRMSFRHQSRGITYKPGIPIAEELSFGLPFSEVTICSYANVLKQPSFPRVNKVLSIISWKRKPRLNR